LTPGCFKSWNISECGGTCSFQSIYIY
jgi:hypothetical protein